LDRLHLGLDAQIKKEVAMKTAIVLALLLTGCASLPPGVAMTDEERAACAAEGCYVFTPQERDVLAAHWFTRGFEAGKKRRGELSL